MLTAPSMVMPSLSNCVVYQLESASGQLIGRLAEVPWQGISELKVARGIASYICPTCRKDEIFKLQGRRHIVSVWDLIIIIILTLIMIVIVIIHILSIFSDGLWRYHASFTTCHHHCHRDIHHHHCHPLHIVRWMTMIACDA